MAFLKVYIPRFGFSNGCVVDSIEGPDVPTKEWLASISSCTGATYIEVLSGADGFPVMTYLVAPEIYMPSELQDRMTKGVVVSSADMESTGLWYLWPIANGGQYAFTLPCGSVFIVPVQGLIYKAVRQLSSPTFKILQ